MINKLERIIEVERQVSDRRNASKIRYQEILSEFKQKSNDGVKSLHEDLMVERELLLKEAHEQAMHDMHDIDVIKDREIADLKKQYEARKDDVVKRVIQEVFNNGNR